MFLRHILRMHSKLALKKGLELSHQLWRLNLLSQALTLVLIFNYVSFFV